MAEGALGAEGLVALRGTGEGYAFPPAEQGLLQPTAKVHAHVIIMICVCAC